MASATNGCQSQIICYDRDFTCKFDEIARMSVFSHCSYHGREWSLRWLWRILRVDNPPCLLGRKAQGLHVEALLFIYKRTDVYVDALNFYYGVLKDT